MVDKTTKNARIYGFPGIFDPRFRLFPGNFHQNLEFSRNFGVTRHEIPGNFGRKTPVKCRNIRVSRLFRGKIHNFPGNFGRPVAESRKRSSYPRRAPSRIYGFPGPPRRTFWTLKKTPKNLFALNGLYMCKKRPIFCRNFAKNCDKILQKIHENVDLKKCSYQVVKTEMCRLFFENIFYLFFFRPKICT